MTKSNHPSAENPSPNQPLDQLLAMVAATQPDSLDCDDCLEHISHYAEVHLQGLPLQEQLAAVKTHLENCPCCEDEFEYLMRALEVLESEE